MLAYGKLSWTEPLLTSLEESSRIVGCVVEKIKQDSQIPLQSALHLGSGAGLYDYTF